MVDVGCCGDKYELRPQQHISEHQVEPSAGSERTESRTEGSAVEVDVGSQGDHAEPTVEHRAGDLDRPDQDTGGDAGGRARREHAILGPRHARVVERARHPQRDRQVELPHPQHVDAGRARDLLHVLDPGLGLDLQDDERAVLRGADRPVHTVGQLVRVEQPEAAAAVRREPCRLDDARGLGCVVDHRHHDTAGAQVERRRDQVARRTLHANQQLHLLRPAGREERTDPLHAPSRVLQVDQREVRPGGGEDPRDAERVELEQHRAERRPSASQARAQRLGRHPASPG